MQIIYKYSLGVTMGGRSEVYLPKGATFLDVQLQDDIPTLWALIDTDADYEIVKLLTTGTGMYLPPEPIGEHIATYQDGGLVWHVFFADVIDGK